MKRSREEEMQLVEAAASGDAAAQETIYTDYNRTVRNAIWKVMNDLEYVEDLTQIAFAQFFRKIKLFRGDSMLSTYLYRLAANEALMERRRRAKKVDISPNFTVESPNGPSCEMEFDQPDPLKLTVGERIDIRRALDGLPPGYRKTLVLKEVYGYEHNEIARMMQVSEGTVKSQLHKAKLKMRRLLNTVANPKIYERQITPAV